MNTLLALVIGGSAAGLTAVLVHILVIALIFGLILWLLSYIPIPEPFGGIVRTVVLVIGCILIIVQLLSLL